MPVNVRNTAHFNTPQGVPGAPTGVTSVTADAAATVSFYAPADPGDSAITHYVVTPRISGTPQSATTIPVASLTSLATSAGATALQAAVTGLTNSTAYTFTVRARNAFGDSAESDASGENTPLSGLVFGDDFNGPAGGAIDPEWWVLNRCGYIAQSEVQWYLPSQCVLDGSGNLALIAEHTSHSGTSYPSDGNQTRNQAWLSGACQSNAKTWAPAAGNTMTFESKFQICPGGFGPMWPGLFWLVGQAYLDGWKTDPEQQGPDTTTHAEIDIAEWISGHTVHDYAVNMYTGTSYQQSVNTALDFSAGMHVFTCRWKPGASVTWLRDGAQTNTTSSGCPASGCQFMLLLYLQIIAGTASSPQQCTLDYVRVFDQNLG